MLATKRVTAIKKVAVRVKSEPEKSKDLDEKGPVLASFGDPIAPIELRGFVFDKTSGKTPHRQFLEHVSQFIHVKSIAMEKSGKWIMGGCKLCKLDQWGGWFSPRKSYYVRPGILPSVPNWEKSLEVLDIEDARW